MEKLQSTARKLDIFFRIVHIFITVALVASLVGMAIIGAYFLFDLSPAMIGTGYGSVELGFLDLEIADSVELSVDVIILGAAAELALGFLCLLTVRHCVQCVRNILAPMTDGTPFNGAASQNLGKLARYTLILGIKLQPSTIWWLFLPASCRMCRLMGQFLVKPRKNSSTNSVSKVPIFWVGISRP